MEKARKNKFENSPFLPAVVFVLLLSGSAFGNSGRPMDDGIAAGAPFPQLAFPTPQWPIRCAKVWVASILMT
jgi:hypothetical protein